MKVSLLPPIAAPDIAAPMPWLWLVVAGLGLLGLLGLIGLWLLLGRGPRRARGYRRSQRLIRQGKWQEALSIVHGLQHWGRVSRFWQGRLKNAEGECHRTAGVQAVQAGDFEKGLEHHLQAAELLNINPAEVRSSVIERMLSEARRQFAQSRGQDTEALQEMLTRILMLKSPCPEASFWQGLAFIREGKMDLAAHALQAARDAGTAGGTDADKAAGTTSFVDPPLYLGGTLLKLGQPKEGLRYISEANRIDSNVPLVALQLGMAMVAAGADGNLATRALNRALGQRGLPIWHNHPEKVWVEGFPEGRSFVRKLASQHPFVCPLWGNDLRVLVRQGQMALGQAYYRMQQYGPAAETFQKLLDDSAPTHDVLRWLGVALARLERYDEAFKHLKTAFDLEDPKDRLTAGYLALCAACGKPNKPEDKGPNVAWAVRTVRAYEGFGDPEWVWLVGQVFGEALALNMALSGEDEVYLADHLVSVEATDKAAALAYHRVVVEHPELLKSVYAWLYCRAAMEHHVEHERTLELFARTFQTAAEARAYFAAHQWDFEELEFAYLRQAAIRQPGAFPAALGADYPARGESMLLQRSERLEQENKPDAALASADVLLRLAPHSPHAHDRLARLYYKRGKLDRAAELLRNWCNVEPASAIPWTRLAVVQHQLAQWDQSLQSMQAALERSSGTQRADLACLAARLALASTVADKTAAGTPAPSTGENSDGAWDQAQAFLNYCLNQEPSHQTGLWLMAAVRSVRGDREGLAAQTAAMAAQATDDPRFAYFAAVCALAAGDYPAVLALAGRAAVDPALQVECAYLAGWASIHSRDPEGALTAMQVVAQSKDSASAQHARAIVGAIRFHQGAADDAARWWQGLEPERRSAWNLTAPLQGALFLAGLQALKTSKYEQAADKFREASQAGLRDKSLGSLIHYALVRAAQQLLDDRGAA
jgi:tetratricopeptide (TPR) repeat protein